MNIRSVSSADLAGVSVETKTDLLQYEATDCQVSNTASIQHELLSGTELVLTLQDIS